MEQKNFFVSFEDNSQLAMQVYYLRNTVRRMNEINRLYEPEGTADAVKLTPAVFHGHGGYFVSGQSNGFKDTCWDILMHKYLSMSNDEESGVFFYQKDYAMMKQQKQKMMAVETA